MGKALIIKGADFSGISVKKTTFVKWLFGYTDTQISTHSQGFSSNFVFAPSSDFDNYFAGKNIVGIKMYSSAIGTIGIYKFKKSDGTTTLVKSASVVPGINSIELDSAIECGTDYTVGITARDLAVRDSSGWSFRSDNNPSVKATPGFVIDFAEEVVINP